MKFYRKFAFFSNQFTIQGEFKGILRGIEAMPLLEV